MAKLLFVLVTVVAFISSETGADPIKKILKDACQTNYGETGTCRAFKSCYPVLSLIANSVLREDVMEASTPCNSKDLIVKDEEDIICCPTNLRKKIAGTGIDTLVVGVSKAEEVPSGSGKTETTTTTAAPPLVESSCSSANVVNLVSPAGEDIAPVGAYPYMVALTNTKGRQFCGASLVDNYHVLTAAHCIAHFKKPSDLSKLKVQLAAHNLQKEEPNRQAFSVESIMQHADYNDSTIENDIALLRLSKPANFSKLVSPICLNNRGGYDDGKQMATLSGWGRTSVIGRPSPVLRHVNMRVWTNQECSDRYSQILSPGSVPKVQPGMVCGGSPGADACHGDSGGPLVMKRDNGSFYEQVGVVSWGVGCGIYPGVYTRVDTYLPWINKNRGIDKRLPFY